MAFSIRFCNGASVKNCFHYMSATLALFSGAAFLKVLGSTADGFSISFETLHAADTTSSRRSTVLFVILVILFFLIFFISSLRGTKQSPALHDDWGDCFVVPPRNDGSYRSFSIPINPINPANPGSHKYSLMLM